MAAEEKGVLSRGACQEKPVLEQGRPDFSCLHSSVDFSTVEGHFASRETVIFSIVASVRRQHSYRPVLGRVPNLRI